MSVYPNKLEKQLAAGEDVEGREEEPGLPHIPDPDYSTPYIPCPATPSPDYAREKSPAKRDLWGNARRYRGKQESADPRRTLKEALKNRSVVFV